MSLRNVVFELNRNDGRLEGAMFGKLSQHPECSTELCFIFRTSPVKRKRFQISRDILQFLLQNTVASSLRRLLHFVSHLAIRHRINSRQNVHYTTTHGPINGITRGTAIGDQFTSVSALSFVASNMARSGG
jgi:hypothetical protein